MARKLLVTPKGVAVYPHLTKPDTKFAKDGSAGTYHTKLRLAGDVATSLVAAIDAGMQEALTEGKADLTAKIAEETNSEKKKKLQARLKKLALVDAPYSVDDDTQEVTFSFKMNAEGKNKKGETFTKRPAIFDANAQPLVDPKIGAGSIIKVSYELTKFCTPLGAGVSLRLAGVQVLVLKEWGSDATTFGFAAEDDGEETGETTTTTDDDLDELPGGAPSTTEDDDSF